MLGKIHENDVDSNAHAVQENHTIAIH